MTLQKRFTGSALALVLASTMFTGAAFGQAMSYTEADDDSLEVAPLGMTVDQIEDMDLYMDDGTAVGDIDHVLLDDAGTPVALAVDPDDNLGIQGDGDLVVTIDQVTAEGMQVTTSLDQQSILELPMRDE